MRTGNIHILNGSGPRPGPGPLPGTQARSGPAQGPAWAWPMQDVYIMYVCVQMFVRLHKFACTRSIAQMGCINRPLCNSSTPIKLEGVIHATSGL